MKKIFVESVSGPLFLSVCSNPR